MGIVYSEKKITQLSIYYEAIGKNPNLFMSDSVT